MSDYFLAPALVALRDEVNTRFPNRDRATDGWIGDPSHAARKSDHNPCWTCPGEDRGIVRAVDIDITPDGDPDHDLRAAIIRYVINDRRTYYAISNGKIYSRTYGMAARIYKGNPHSGHVHVSLRGSDGCPPTLAAELARDTSAWFSNSKGARSFTKWETVSLAVIQRASAFPGRAVAPLQVQLVQRALAARGYPPGAVDGIYGPATRAAVARLQGRLGRIAAGAERGGILGIGSATFLSANRFRLTA